VWVRFGCPQVRFFSLLILPVNIPTHMRFRATSQSRGIVGSFMLLAEKDEGSTRTKGSQQASCACWSPGLRWLGLSSVKGSCRWVHASSLESIAVWIHNTCRVNNVFWMTIILYIWRHWPCTIPVDLPNFTVVRNVFVSTVPRKKDDRQRHNIPRYQISSGFPTFFQSCGSNSYVTTFRTGKTPRKFRSY